MISKHKQRGAALIVALALLVVITMVGLAALRGTGLQTRMSANLYDRQIAFNNANDAIEEAEQHIRDGQQENLSNGTPGQWVFDADTVDDCSATGGNECLINPFEDKRASGFVQTAKGAQNKLAAGNGQYVIQFMGRDGDGHAVYRITTRSHKPNADNDDRALVMLQAIFRQV